jgi:NDP-sugar pyrophosphorylase family protein
MRGASEDKRMPDTAIVLAGGLGTRLRQVVNDRPKVLAQAHGRPFLGYVLNFLVSQRIRHMILSVGYMADQIKTYAGDGSRWEIKLDYSVEQKPLGTGGALKLASKELQKAFFALNGDTLFAADLLALWQAHSSAEADATIALLPVQGGQERGCVALAEDGRILSFDEKPPVVDQALINGGVYVIEPRALESIQIGQQVSMERQVFPMLAAQRRLFGQVQMAYFTDIGTPQSLAAFEGDVKSGKIDRLISEFEEKGHRTQGKPGDDRP